MKTIKYDRKKPEYLTKIPECEEWKNEVMSLNIYKKMHAWRLIMKMVFLSVKCEYQLWMVRLQKFAFWQTDNSGIEIL